VIVNVLFMLFTVLYIGQIWTLAPMFQKKFNIMIHTSIQLVPVKKLQLL